MFYAMSRVVRSLAEGSRGHFWGGSNFTAFLTSLRGCVQTNTSHIFEKVCRVPPRTKIGGKVQFQTEEKNLEENSRKISVEMDDMVTEDRG